MNQDPASRSPALVQGWVARAARSRALKGWTPGSEESTERYEALSTGKRLKLDWPIYGSCKCTGPRLTDRFLIPKKGRLCCSDALRGMVRAQGKDSLFWTSVAVWKEVKIVKNVPQRLPDSHPMDKTSA